MRYQIDHDFHIHSYLSYCSQKPEQNPQRMLQYAIENKFKHICLTDHFWDEAVPGMYQGNKWMTFSHIQEILPLPQAEGVDFYFGAEGDMDADNYTLGITRETIDKLDFFIAGTTHLTNYWRTIDGDTVEQRRKRYLEMFWALLEKDLPFEKMGIAHLTDGMIMKDGKYLDVISGIPDSDYAEVFTEAAKKGLGIELNFRYYNASEREIIECLRPFKVASKCGCKFYLGSDAHSPGTLDRAMDAFTYMVDYLDLTEDQKFMFAK